MKRYKSIMILFSIVALCLPMTAFSEPLTLYAAGSLRTAMGEVADAYEKVYPNLVKHDSEYPRPQYLRERHVLGNVDAEGEMDNVTPGSRLIVKVLLDETDDRPIWLQAWGGPNTIARALKTIEERHPDKVEVASSNLARVIRKIYKFIV